MTNPAEALQVANNIYATGDLIAGGGLRVSSRLWNSGDWFAEYGWANVSGSNTADLVMKTSNTARISVKAGGNVGHQ